MYTSAKEKKVQKKGWPEWESPSDKIQLELAHALMPHIKILNPVIVSRIVEENNKHIEPWTKAFKSRGIRPEIFLWENSPVAFPGIRRHVGKIEEMRVKQNRTSAVGENAIRLDDNSYPKEIWSFVLRGGKADKHGPDGFSLAHVIDHKDYKSRHSIEIVNYLYTNQKHRYAGLHTSCANTIWVPNSLMKPTDHKGPLRQLMLQIAHKHYSGICQLLPNMQQLNLLNIKEDWQIDKFEKPEIVGDFEHVEKFITYRNTLINNLLEV